eukprot:scaffold323284_cov41-Tisochrysis_lutea.AAC.2
MTTKQTRRAMRNAAKLQTSRQLHWQKKTKLTQFISHNALVVGGWWRHRIRTEYINYSGFDTPRLQSSVHARNGSG